VKGLSRRSVFNLHSAVLGDYRDFARSFFSGDNDRVVKFG